MHFCCESLNEPLRLDPSQLLSEPDPEEYEERNDGESRPESFLGGVFPLGESQSVTESCLCNDLDDGERGVSAGEPVTSERRRTFDLSSS